MAELNLKVIEGNTELAPAMRQFLQPLLDMEGVKEVEHTADANRRLVIGGDGTALHEARRDIIRAKREDIDRVVPIFGVKAGSPNSVGMFLNDMSQFGTNYDAILEAIKNSQCERFHYLDVGITTASGRTKNWLAFNEAVMSRAGRRGQEASTRLIINGTTYEDNLRGDGLIVCTSQGSTAYNRKAGGIVATKFDTIQITGLASDLRSSLLLEETDCVRLETMDPEKRPQKVEVDGPIKSHDARIVEVRQSDLYSLMCFLEGYNYRHKMILKAIGG